MNPCPSSAVIPVIAAPGRLSSAADVEATPDIDTAVPPQDFSAMLTHATQSSEVPSAQPTVMPGSSAVRFSSEKDSLDTQPTDGVAGVTPVVSLVVALQAIDPAQNALAAEVAEITQPLESHAPTHTAYFSNEEKNSVFTQRPAQPCNAPNPVPAESATEARITTEGKEEEPGTRQPCEFLSPNALQTKGALQPNPAEGKLFLAGAQAMRLVAPADSPAPERSALPEFPVETDEAPDFSLGTVGAEQPGTMKHGTKGMEPAGAAEQKVAAEVLPGDAEVTKNSQSSDAARHDVVQPGKGSVALQAEVTAAKPLEMPGLAGAKELSLERTHDIIALHALRLREFDGHSMRVVIEPSEAVKLAVELYWGERGIEAHAHLHRGDLQAMSQHWGELQQRLETRGVILAPLTSGSNPQTETGERQQHRWEQAEPEVEPGYEDCFKPGRASAKRVLARTAANWEGWA